jgi:hypothetical protein
VRQLLDLVGHDGEALARLAGARRLDVAFSASRLVCAATVVMTVTACSISSADRSSVPTVVSAWLTSSTAVVADSVNAPADALSSVDAAATWLETSKTVSAVWLRRFSSSTRRSVACAIDSRAALIVPAPRRNAPGIPRTRNWRW